MLPNKIHAVNRSRRKSNRFDVPESEEIPALWREYLAMESLTPDYLRGGLARARTALLAGIPEWKIPDVLDALGAGGAA